MTARSIPTRHSTLARSTRALGRRIAAGTLWLAASAIIAAPMLAPHTSGQQFREFLYAPPMRPHLVDAAGAWHTPFVYPIRLTSRLERTYGEDRSRRIPLVWFSKGKLVRAANESQGPLLLLGSDGLGRDIFSRLILGARASLGVALVAVCGALLLGILAGGVAGYAGGLADEALTAAAEFVLVLPAIYVALALRTAMPLVLPSWAIFLSLATILALVGWPYVARGVRAIVASELGREYATAARSLGAGHTRVLCRHLLPATRGYLVVQSALLLPSFILAEATLSYVGLGFAEPTPSWGSMLGEAANIPAIAEFPWLFSPAIAIAVIVLAINVLLPVRTMIWGEPEVRGV